MPAWLWGPRYVDKLRHTQPIPPSHSASRSPSLSGLSLCTPKYSKRVRSPHDSNLRSPHPRKSAECWPALLHPRGTALFIYETVRRLMNSRCGFTTWKLLSPELIRIAPTNPFLMSCWKTDGKGVILFPRPLCSWPTKFMVYWVLGPELPISLRNFKSGHSVTS